MYDLNNIPKLASAVGRLRKIEGILIGDEIYNGGVWGRADIGVSADPGKGYGKALILKMNEYAKNNGMLSCIGLHGKQTTLSHFYEKCGLQVDYELWKKIFKLKDGQLVSLSGVNVSYLQGDHLIQKIQVSREVVTLPLRW